MLKKSNSLTLVPYCQLRVPEYSIESVMLRLDCAPRSPSIPPFFLRHHMTDDDGDFSLPEIAEYFFVRKEVTILHFEFIHPCQLLRYSTSSVIVTRSPQYSQHRIPGTFCL